MMHEDNGNLNRFFSLLDQRLSRIEISIDKLGDSHDARAKSLEIRVAALELRAATQAGGNKMLTAVAAGAATIGGIVAHLVGKFWA
jgi:hypothetical protein